MKSDFWPHEIVWTPEKVRNLWGYYSTNRAYDNSYFSYHSGRSIVEFIKRYIPLAERRVVDFGCGLGFMIGHLLHEGIPCEGVEFSVESVDAVRKEFGDHPLFRGVVEVADLPLPFEDESVDVVLLVEVAEHLLSEQILPTMHEILRILHRGGHLVVTVPNNENLKADKVICPECGCIFHRWQHQRSFTVGSLTSFMEEVGFSTVASQAAKFGARSPLGPVRRVYRLLRGTPYPSPHLVYIGQKLSG